jgi:(p)ppGpp synthase/HD superfamily hydrolase
LYSGQPYGTHHLYPVAVLAEQYAYLLPVQMHETVIAGAWLHDFVEDAYGSMNDLTKLLNLAIARTAQLCVSSTGATRAERHDAAYHGRVASTMESTYVKLVDRLRNVTAGDGTRKGDSMREGYRKEQPAFESHLAVAGNYPNLLPLMDAINTALGL